MTTASVSGKCPAAMSSAVILTRAVAQATGKHIIIRAGSGASGRGSKTKEKAKSKKETTGERERIDDGSATGD
jgi:hypothetical protein